MVKLKTTVKVFQKPFTREDFEGQAVIVKATPHFTHAGKGRFQRCEVQFREEDGKGGPQVERWIELAPGQDEISGTVPL